MRPDTRKCWTNIQNMPDKKIKEKLYNSEENEDDNGKLKNRNDEPQQSNTSTPSGKNGAAAWQMITSYHSNGQQQSNTSEKYIFGIIVENFNLNKYMKRKFIYLRSTT